MYRINSRLRQIVLVTTICLFTSVLAGFAPSGAQSSGPQSNLSAGGFSAEPGSSATGLSGLAGAMSSTGQPLVQADEPLYNFGTTYNGTPVKHTFRIKNAGTAPLIIGAVSASCGCTAAKPTKNTVAPGEVSDIMVTFDTRADKGPATRVITVATNDPRHQQLQLTLKGDVKLQVEAEPSPVAFGNVRHGSEQGRQVMITDLVGGRDFKVGPITNSSSDIKVSQQPRTDGKPGAMLTITLLKSMPPGPFTDIVKVSTSRTPVDVTVFGNIVGDLAVNPPQVSFGIVPHHESALRIVRLTNSGEQAINVLGVESNNQSVTAALEPIKPGKEYKITLQLRPNTPDGTLRGMLTIRTDDPRQNSLQVPFYGIAGSFQG
jgi:uncharacterized protein DUF1573